jgi:hypothetical protein
MKKLKDDKNIKWKELYTKRTRFLKEQFESVVGPNSYFRYEGNEIDGPGKWNVVVGPAGVREEHKAKYFAGVRRLPDTYPMGGKHFDNIVDAINYAHETWGTPEKKPGQPVYTKGDLSGITGRINEWKEVREEREKQEGEAKKESSFDFPVFIVKTAMAKSVGDTNDRADISLHLGSFKDILAFIENIDLSKLKNNSDRNHLYDRIYGQLLIKAGYAAQPPIGASYEQEKAIYLEGMKKAIEELDSSATLVRKKNKALKGHLHEEYESEGSIPWDHKNSALAKYCAMDEINAPVIPGNEHKVAALIATISRAKGTPALVKKLSEFGMDLPDFGAFGTPASPFEQALVSGTEYLRKKKAEQGVKYSFEDYIDDDEVMADAFVTYGRRGSNTLMLLTSPYDSSMAFDKYWTFGKDLLDQDSQGGDHIDNALTAFVTLEGAKGVVDSTPDEAIPKGIKSRIKRALKGWKDDETYSIYEIASLFSNVKSSDVSKEAVKDFVMRLKMASQSDPSEAASLSSVVKPILKDRYYEIDGTNPETLENRPLNSKEIEELLESKEEDSTDASGRRVVAFARDGKDIKTALLSAGVPEDQVDKKLAALRLVLQGYARGVGAPNEDGYQELWRAGGAIHSDRNFSNINQMIELYGGFYAGTIKIGSNLNNHGLSDLINNNSEYSLSVLSKSDVQVPKIHLLDAIRDAYNRPAPAAVFLFKSDDGSGQGDPTSYGGRKDLKEIEAFVQGMPNDIVTGRDLISSGFNPNIILSLLKDASGADHDSYITVDNFIDSVSSVRSGKRKLGSYHMNILKQKLQGNSTEPVTSVSVVTARRALKSLIPKPALGKGAKSKRRVVDDREVDSIMLRSQKNANIDIPVMLDVDDLSLDFSPSKYKYFNNVYNYVLRISDYGMHRSSKAMIGDVLGMRKNAPELYEEILKNYFVPKQVFDENNNGEFEGETAADRVDAIEAALDEYFSDPNRRQAFVTSSAVRKSGELHMLTPVGKSGNKAVKSSEIYYNDALDKSIAILAQKIAKGETDFGLSPEALQVVVPKLKNIKVKLGVAEEGSNVKKSTVKSIADVDIGGIPIDLAKDVTRDAKKIFSSKAVQDVVGGRFLIPSVSFSVASSTAIAPTSYNQLDLDSNQSGIYRSGAIDHFESSKEDKDSFFDQIILGNLGYGKFLEEIRHGRLTTISTIPEVEMSEGKSKINNANIADAYFMKTHGKINEEANEFYNKAVYVRDLIEQYIDWSAANPNEDGEDVVYIDGEPWYSYLSQGEMRASNARRIMRRHIMNKIKNGTLQVPQIQNQVSGLVEEIVETLEEADGGLEEDIGSSVEVIGDDPGEVEPEIPEDESVDDEDDEEFGIDDNDSFNAFDLADEEEEEEADEDEDDEEFGIDDDDAFNIFDSDDEEEEEPVQAPAIQPAPSQPAPSAPKDEDDDWDELDELFSNDQISSIRLSGTEGMLSLASLSNKYVEMGNYRRAKAINKLLKEAMMVESDSRNTLFSSLRIMSSASEELVQAGKFKSANEINEIIKKYINKLG